MKNFTQKIKGLHIYSFGKIRKLYDFVLSLADKKYSAQALFSLAFIESSFFPIPPDVLQIALSVSKPKKSFFYAFISTIGSVLGGILGYAIGLFLFESLGKLIINAFGYQNYFETVKNLYQTYAFWAIFAAAFTPIPYKVFTIAAGLFSINIPIFIFASSIGRAGRFFLVAALIYFFGIKIKNFIDRYFNLLTLIFLFLFIFGFIIVKIFAK